MLNLFKKKCPVCKMIIKEKYVEGFGQKFCSEKCKETYGEKMDKDQPRKSNECGYCN